MNNNSRIGLEDALKGNNNATTCTINLIFDFREQIFEKEYYNFWELLVRMGGLGASMIPVVSLVSQLLLLRYLIKIAEIIK